MQEEQPVWLHVGFHLVRSMVADAAVHGSISQGRGKAILLHPAITQGGLLQQRQPKADRKLTAS